MEEKVDILLTTYNTEIEYLKIQIDSILNQTYKNINLIISDDCSSNVEVRKVLEEYKQKDSRIELYFQKTNLGYTKNFEYVLTKSTAEYISFADHDDIWYPTKIEESIKTLKEQNVDLVYCDANQINEEGKIIQKSYLKYKKMPIINKRYNKKIIPFSRHIAIGCSQVFTKAVKEKMLPFTVSTMAHDWCAEYIASRQKGIYCINKQLFGYRLHGNNAFGGRSFKQNIEIWKNENGKNYKSYLKYRYRVIVETYLAGVIMCQDYNERLENKELEETENKVIQYFMKAQKNKIIYFPIHKYIKYLYFKGIGKRALKEIMILHFPILSYIIFRIV